MLSSIISFITNIVGKVLPLLFAYKSGKDSQRNKETEGVLNSATQAKKAKESINNMSKSERDKWL